MKAVSQSELGVYYFSANSSYELSGTPKILGAGGIFVPNDKSKLPVSYIFSETLGQSSPVYGSKPVNFIDSPLEEWSTDSFKRELIYGGLSQRVISLSYREFMDGTARPAFTQELKYDLNDGNLIGFRGARIEVIKATNTIIQYKVIRPLD
jgi:hypothetical protein